MPPHLHRLDPQIRRRGGDSAGDGLGAGPAPHFAFGQSRLQRQPLIHIFADDLGVQAELIQREVFQGLACRQRVPHQLADFFVGIAEGDTFGDEVIGEVGGVGIAALCRALRVFGAELEGFDDAGGDAKGDGEVVHGIEEAFLVFLQVFVVGEGEAFEGDEESDEIADDAA